MNNDNKRVFILHTNGCDFCYRDSSVNILIELLKDDKLLSDLESYVSSFYVDPGVPDNFTDGMELKYLRDWDTVNTVEPDKKFGKVSCDSFEDYLIDYFDHSGEPDYKYLWKQYWRDGGNFIFAISYLLNKGFENVKAITDEEIDALEGNGIMTAAFCQEMVSMARDIARYLSDPLDLISFCEIVELFDISEYKIPYIDLIDALNQHCSHATLNAISNSLQETLGTETGFLDENGFLKGWDLS